VAGDLPAALGVLAGLGADNGAPRALESAGFTVRDLAGAPWTRFDVDTPLDLALLRLATRLPGARALELGLTAFLEGVQLPGGRPLEIPRLEALLQSTYDRAGCPATVRTLTAHQSSEAVRDTPAFAHGSAL